MTFPQTDLSKTIKVVLTFLGAGSISGFGFGLIVTRTTHRHLWVTKKEWWLFPTWKYWLVAVCSLIVALVVAYVISLRQRWLSSEKGRWHDKLVALLLLSAIFPVLTWLVDFGPSYGFIFVSITLATLVSLSLWAVTRVWDRRVATLILVVCLLRTPLASIPDALMIRPMPGIWFDAFRFFIVLSLISGLSGYWLARSEHKQVLRDGRKSRWRGFSVGPQ